MIDETFTTYNRDPVLEALTAELAEARAEVERLKGALEWYGEQARLARLIHSGGDAGRHALAKDGGSLARAAGAERSAHGLRKNRLMAIAEACGSAHAIMAWGGHVSMKEAEDYCRAANLEGMVVGVKHSDVLQNAAEKP